MSSGKELRPLYVQVHPSDTVAIIVNEGGLPAGTRFDSGLVLVEDIPEAHKVALVDIPAGAPVLRYGSVIGFAATAIAKGSWVHEERMRLPLAPSLDNLPLATAVPSPMAALESATFEGFLNDDGSVGTKNILGITTTVQCVAATVDFAVQRIKAEILPHYPNVDDVIALSHT
jgi:galactarate dehydratase